MDFVFDRVADGRVIKCLVIVDDGTHEAVAIDPEHSIGGERLTRLLDRISSLRGRPKVILKTAVDGRMLSKFGVISATCPALFCNPNSTALQLKRLLGNPRQI